MSRPSSIADQFRAGTDTAEAALKLVLGELNRVRWSRETNRYKPSRDMSQPNGLRWSRTGTGARRVYDFPDVGSGVVVPGVDGHGRVGLAFYRTDKPHAHFKRRSVSSAACDRWLPLPLAWAHINGLQQSDLTPAELGRWALRLLDDVELGPLEWQRRPTRDVPKREVPKLTAKYVPLPDPSGVRAAARWLELFGVERGGARRRLPAKQERLMHTIYHWFVAQWRRRGANRIVPASDDYVAQQILRKTDDEFRAASPVAQRERVRRAIGQLEAAGLIVAVQAVGEQRDDKGKRLKSAHYGYMAGTGEDSAARRQQRISARAPLTALRRLTGKSGWRDKA